MALVVLCVTFVALLIAKTPVAFAMGLASLAYLVTTHSGSLTIIVQRMVAGPQSFTLLAIPFFVLAGQLMSSGRSGDRVFRFARALLGHIRGGLAMANIAASMVFAGMSGTAVADTAGLGPIEMKAMREAGYDDAFSAAVTIASSTIGPIIPPSTMMALYAVMAEVSLGRLFAGGYVPGFIMGAFLMAYCRLVARRQNLAVLPRAPRSELVSSFVAALPTLMTPVILLGGILTGIMTPTEAGAAAVAYGLIVAICYRDLSLRGFLDMLEETVLLTATIMFVLSASNVFGWLVILENVPDMITQFLAQTVRSPALVLLILNAGLLLLGCVVNPTAIQIIVTPVVVALANAMGFDLVHLGLILVLNLSIGLITPPVGWCLYMISDIAKCPFERVVRATIPFVLVLVAALLVITYFPGTVLFLPRLLFD